MFLLVGLGNKGKKFSDTRHNIGFKVVDKIIEYTQVHGEKKRYQNNLKAFQPTPIS